jgi:hypothetical protein
MIKGWKYMMLHRWTLDKPGTGMKNRMITAFGTKMWGPRRTLPKIAPKNFRHLWKERQTDDQNR